MTSKLPFQRGHSVQNSFEDFVFATMLQKMIFCSSVLTRVINVVNLPKKNNFVIKQEKSLVTTRQAQDSEDLFKKEITSCCFLKASTFKVIDFCSLCCELVAAIKGK